MITISRAGGSLTYPSNIMVVAAMNPCPCGFLGHPTKDCTCSQAAVNRYRDKVSGPILDRIDMPSWQIPPGANQAAPFGSG